MNDLLTLLRDHDLPPRWDGRVVVWQGWEPPLAPVFICPPLPSCCEGCGSTAEGPSNHGLVAVSPRLTLDDLRAEDEKRARLGPIAHKRKPRAYARLLATRCPDCRLDVVWDIEGDEWWNLDHTDYGDAGSTRPPDPAS